MVGFVQHKVINGRKFCGFAYRVFEKILTKVCVYPVHMDNIFTFYTHIKKSNMQISKDVVTH